MTPIAHPGRLLKRELRVRNLDAGQLALSLGMPLDQVADVLDGRCGISADMAVRLGRYFGNSPQFWSDLQSQHDIAVIERDHGEEISRQVHPLAMAC